MVFLDELEEQEVEKVSVRFAGDPDRRKPGELITYIMPHDEILKKYGPPRLNKYVLTSLLGNGKSIAEIAKMFGVAGGDINNLINRYQIDFDKIKERNKLKEELQMREAKALLEAMEKLPKEDLIRLLESGKTTSDITRENNIPKSTMGKLKRFYCLTPDTKGLENEFGYNKKMEHTFNFVKKNGVIKPPHKTEDTAPEGDQPAAPGAELKREPDIPKDTPDPDPVPEKQVETQPEIAAADPVPQKPKQLLGTSFDGTAQEVSGALSGIQNFIISLNRKVEVEISVKEVS